VAYAIFKRAGSFSAGAETVGQGKPAEPHELTLMDFASAAQAGSEVRQARLRARLLPRGGLTAVGWRTAGVGGLAAWPRHARRRRILRGGGPSIMSCTSAALRADCRARRQAASDARLTCPTLLAPSASKTGTPSAQVLRNSDTSQLYERKSKIAHDYTAGGPSMAIVA
jgi:hypothetical protein